MIQTVGNGIKHFFRFKRLFNKVIGIKAEYGNSFLFIRIARNHDYFRILILLLDLLQHIYPAHFRHDDIKNYEINVLRREYFKTFRAAPGSHHIIAIVME